MAQATTTAKRPQKRGQPQKREQKRDQQRNWAHGNFHWNELRTRDAERARRFYADTIGWTFEAMATPDGHTYWVAMQDGKPVAGLFPLTSPQFDEVPESWMSFLAVDDVDKRVAKAVAAGARLVMPVFDVPGVGRIAMLREPGGAGIGWMTPVDGTAAKA
ncbi:MAG: VOC family protein [Hyphomicrobiaceae bacterium]|jgi:predicted enzyme related to lactoylglutathione lyase